MGPGFSVGTISVSYKNFEHIFHIRNSKINSIGNKNVQFLLKLNFSNTENEREKVCFWAEEITIFNPKGLI